MSASQKRKSSALDDEADLHQQVNSAEQYTIGWICALPIESAAAVRLLDEEHPDVPNRPGDNNAYRFGRIGDHNIVIGCLPAGRPGLVSTANVAQQMKHSFINVRLGLMVGIGGAVPSMQNDIRLGDIVVSQPHGQHGGVVQYDSGKTRPNGEMERTGSLNSPPDAILTALSKLQTTEEMNKLCIEEHLQHISVAMPRYSFPETLGDYLYKPDQQHGNGANCSGCGSDGLVKREQRADATPVIHYGTIASGNQVMKDGVTRDKISRDLGGVLCFEMEAAALMNNFPCLVVRGVSDYSDSHKNDGWQRYAAAVAAAFAKELLVHLAATQVAETQTISAAMAGLSQQMAKNTETARRTEQKIDQRDDREILEWLSASTSFSDVQNATRETRMAGTGQWLVEHTRYLHWISNSGLLWLNGVAGCGKTVLSSTIINNVQRQSDQVAYWYFQFSSTATHNLANMLRSLLRQLIRSAIPDTIRKLWTQHRGNNGEPSTNELIAALFEFVRASTQPIYIVFDALDEFPETASPGRSALLALVKQMAHLDLPFIHVLVTSRREPDIKKALEEVTSSTINIDSLIEIDVDQFVVAALGEYSLARWGEDLATLAKKKLLLSGEKRFRWADLQLKRLRTCPTVTDYRDALETLPKTLEDTYHRALETIDVAYRQHVRRILVWLTTSHREMMSTEVAAVVAFPFVEDVLKICTSVLVTVIDSDTAETIKLAHFTVKEFLLISQAQDEAIHWYKFTTRFAHCCITEQAIDCLFGRPPPPQSKHLRRYAIDNWAVHARQNDSTNDWSDVQSKVDSILAYENRQQFLDWLRIKFPNEMFPISGSRLLVQPLYYASLLGLLANVKAFWRGGSRLKRQEGWFGSALSAAAGMGQVDVVRWYTETCDNLHSFVYLFRILERIQVNIPKTLFTLLYQGPKQRLTHDMINALIQNSLGEDVLGILMAGKLVSISINDDLVRSAIQSRRRNYAILDVLLREPPGDIEMSASTLARIPWHIFETILSVHKTHLNLIGRHLGPSGTGESTLMRITVSGSSFTVAHVVSVKINVLLDSPEHLNLLERVLKSGIHVWYSTRISTVPINESLVKAVVGANHVLDILMLIFVGQARIRQLTEHEVNIIAGQFDLSILETLLKDSKTKIVVSESLVKTVALNRHIEPPSYRLPSTSFTGDRGKLSTRYRPSLKAQDYKQLSAVLGSMMRKAGATFPVTDDVARILARKASPRVFEAFLDNFLERISSTEQVVGAAAQMSATTKLVDIYLTCGLGLGVEQETLSLAKAKFRRAAFSTFSRGGSAPITFRTSASPAYSEMPLPAVLHQVSWSSEHLDLEGTVYVSPYNPATRFRKEYEFRNNERESSEQRLLPSSEPVMARPAGVSLAKMVATNANQPFSTLQLPEDFLERLLGTSADVRAWAFVDGVESRNGLLHTTPLSTAWSWMDSWDGQDVFRRLSNNII